MSLRAAIQSKSAPAGMRIAATLALMLAFFLQSYLVQTHIHGAPAVAGFSLAKILDGDGDDRGTTNKQVPAPDTKCPLCQAAAHGQYLTPVAASALPSLLTVSTIQLTVEIRRLIGTISHSWQCRRAPHHLNAFC